MTRRDYGRMAPEAVAELVGFFECIQRRRLDEIKRDTAFVETTAKISKLRKDYVSSLLDEAVDIASGYGIVSPWIWERLDVLELMEVH